MILVAKYRAYDGVEFSTADDCIKYENLRPIRVAMESYLLTPQCLDTRYNWVGIEAVRGFMKYLSTKNLEVKEC